MKIALIIFCILIISGLFYFFYLGYKSQTGSAPGLLNSKLKPCSSKPNCVCTEYPNDKKHFTDAIIYSSESLKDISKIIELTGGTVIKKHKNYISAIYRSKIFKYVDDFEIHIDTENNLLHLRSASRVGYSDIGANLNRINKFKMHFSRTHENILP